VTVLVLNSTDRNGIARDTSKVLSKAGFNVVKPADDSSTYGGHGLLKGVGEIRYTPSALPSATLLSYYFPHATLRPTDTSATRVLVALGAKFTKVTATPVVRRELDHAHIKLKHRRVVSPTPSPAPC
jgi:hypothetical protein